jgi:hypothetical protein
MDLCEELYTLEPHTGPLRIILKIVARYMKCTTCLHLTFVNTYFCLIVTDAVSLLKHKRLSPEPVQRGVRPWLHKKSVCYCCGAMNSIALQAPAHAPCLLWDGSVRAKVKEKPGDANDPEDSVTVTLSIGQYTEIIQRPVLEVSHRGTLDFFSPTPPHPPTCGGQLP